MSREIQLANRLFHMFQDKYHEEVDEMKLHKLMYLAQRENLVRTDTPLFDEAFRGWKYGPVLKSVREAYRKEIFPIDHGEELSEEDEAVLESVFQKYGEKSSWSLSRLTHGEYSWNQSRRGLNDNDNGDEEILLDDIRKDAERIRVRRRMRRRSDIK